MKLLLTEAQYEALTYLDVEGQEVLLSDETYAIEPFLFDEDEIDPFWVEKLLFAKENPQFIQIVDEQEPFFEQSDDYFSDLFIVKRGEHYLTRDGQTHESLSGVPTRLSRWTLAEVIGSGLNDEVELTSAPKTYAIKVPVEGVIELEALAATYNSPYEAISKVLQVKQGFWYEQISKDYVSCDRIFADIWNRKLRVLSENELEDEKRFRN